MSLVLGATNRAGEESTQVLDEENDGGRVLQHENGPVQPQVVLDDDIVRGDDKADNGGKDETEYGNVDYRAKHCKVLLFQRVPDEPLNSLIAVLVSINTLIKTITVVIIIAVAIFIVEVMIMVTMWCDG